LASSQRCAEPEPDAIPKRWAGVAVSIPRMVPWTDARLARAEAPAPVAYVRAGRVPQQVLVRKIAGAAEGGRSDRVVRWTFKVRDRCADPRPVRKNWSRPSSAL